MGKIFNYPEWYNAWLIITGLLQLIICGFYLFASIGLLQLKTNSIKMFYFTAGAKITHSVINGIVGIATASFIAMSMMLWGALGSIIDIVLLIVVATGDKKAFLPETSQ